ncbi:heme/copper-type cytochrome/quinol oxidase subunit 2 [Bacillus pakistanensis]|uniref:Heme/copper-type cytochrome/quinol oxidase subunit 2 n=1 Tax=Rossellomorea pakistanensis TaxID=992288 RepID=A0ABS2N7Y4_9BACI|nr:heme/copper-type cytochrome/quinol oxidase subunit 2 [Bacillus pakistanensis]
MKKNLLSLAALLPLTVLSGCKNMVVYNSQGPVARSITDLINWFLTWMIIVVVVMIGLFGYILWKYRERPYRK